MCKEIQEGKRKRVKDNYAMLNNSCHMHKSSLYLHHTELGDDACLSMSRVLRVDFPLSGKAEVVWELERWEQGSEGVWSSFLGVDWLRNGFVAKYEVRLYWQVSG